MTKPTSKLVSILAATLFCTALFISCEEKKKETTTTKTTESTTQKPDSMDTGNVRPVITE